MRDFEGVKRGDILQHATTGVSYVIECAISEDRFIGVRTISITNPSEWKNFVQLVNVLKKIRGEKKKCLGGCI